VRFANFGQLPASGPVLPTKEAASRGRFEEQSRQVVSVRITAQGFVLGGVGDLDPRVACKGACDVATYDYEALGGAMVEAKRLHPEEQRVVIAPEAGVPFEVVVRVMDATRDAAGSGGKRVSLFPQPLLAGPPPETP
jgi:biopolymer transport protein ExbD